MLQLVPFQHGSCFFSASESLARLRKPEVAEVDLDLPERLEPVLRDRLRSPLLLVLRDDRLPVREVDLEDLDD